MTKDMGVLYLKVEGLTDQELTDISFRVIADHVRTLAFAIADGIRPATQVGIMFLGEF